MNEISKRVTELFFKYAKHFEGNNSFGFIASGENQGVEKWKLNYCPTESDLHDRTSEEVLFAISKSLVCIVILTKDQASIQLNGIQAIFMHEHLVDVIDKLENTLNVWFDRYAK